MTASYIITTRCGRVIITTRPILYAFYTRDYSSLQTFLDDYNNTTDPTTRKQLAELIINNACELKGIDSTDDEKRKQVAFQLLSLTKEDNMIQQTRRKTGIHNTKARQQSVANKQVTIKNTAAAAINNNTTTASSKGKEVKNNTTDNKDIKTKTDIPSQTSKSNNNMVTLKVKSLTGSFTCKINVNSHHSMVVVKRKILESGYNAPIQSQIIMFDGKKIDNETTIGELGCINGSTLRVTLPLVGAKPGNKKRGAGITTSRGIFSQVKRRRAPPPPPPASNHSQQAQRRAPPPSVNDTSSSSSEQPPTLPQHLQNEELEAFASLDNIIEEVTKPNGNNVYIIKLNLNAKENNILHETSRYVRERVDCVYKIGRTDNDGLKRLSALNVSNFFNLQIKTYKTNNAPVMEQFWHDELKLHNIRGEWFSLPDHLKDLFMNEMAAHEASGCKSFRGVNVDAFTSTPDEYLTSTNTREQWLKDWESEKDIKFKPSNSSNPTADYNETSFLSPHSSFDNILSIPDNLRGRIGVISSYDQVYGRTLKGKQCFYLVKVVVPHGVELTPRDRWLLSRVKYGCSDNIMERFASIQVGCQFDIEMVYFECSDNYVGVEACWKDSFDLQNYRGEWYYVLAAHVKLIFDKMIEYLSSSADLSWQPVGDLSLNCLPEDDILRFMSAQLNSISSKEQDVKIDKLMGTVDNLSIDAALLIEHCLNSKVISLSERINNDLVVESVTGSNTEHNSNKQYLLGGTGIISTERLAPLITASSTDPLGSWSSMLLDAKKGVMTRLLSVYAVNTKQSSSSQTVFGQYQQYINKKRLNTTPRELFESNLIAQLKKWLRVGERLVICMDANENVVSGPLSTKLAQLGLVEVSNDRLGDDTSTYTHGTDQIDGVWMTKDILNGLQGLTFLPPSMSSGDHCTIAFGVTTESILGIETLARSRQQISSIQSSSTPGTFLGVTGSVTKSNRDSFTKTLTNEWRRDQLDQCDKQTRSILILDDCKSPSVDVLSSNQVYRTGPLWEDETYLLLEGIRQHSKDLNKIWRDEKLGLKKIRELDDFRRRSHSYLKAAGLHDDFNNKRVFERLGYRNGEEVPTSWWLELSNEFMIRRVLDIDRSCNKLM